MAVAYEPQAPDREEQEAKLVRMLKGEEEDALGYAQTETTEQQIEALKRYYGDTYGDEEEGRSQVCTREVFETIEWTRPDLMRVFASGGQVVFLEETSPEDGQFAKDAADYLQWIFWTDNRGYEILDDFAFDGLLHRRGYLAVYWRDKEYRAPQTLTGLNIMQVQQLMADPAVEIVGQDFDNESEVGGITLVVRRTKSPARAEIVTVPPEDMRFNGRAVDLDAARYVGRVIRMMRGEVARMWPEKAAEINEYSGKGVGHGQGRRGDDVRAVRFQDNDDDFEADGNDASTELEILEEYLRVDLDEDGYPELIRSYRCGDLMLDFDEVEETPFASWTPIRIPHRFMGLSMHDITADLQRRSTVLTRAALDAVYQAVVNREAYDKNRVPLDELLSTVAGSKIGVDGSPGDAIMPLTGGLDTSKVAFEAINQMSVTLENRTGATRQTQGLDPDALLKGPHSGKAIELLQTAGGARKEMIARNMAAGLTTLFSKLYRLVCRNQNEPRAAKVGGKWAQFDPRTWNSDLRVMIHTGLGTGNREQTVMGLQMVIMEQDKIIEALGPANPLVTAQHRFRALEELLRALGYRSADPFFGEPPEGWAPEPAPDPEAAKLQAEMQMQQAKMQMEAEQTKLQYQKDMELAAQQQTDERERNAVTAMKDERDAALAAEKIALDAERLEFERQKTAAELELKSRELELKGAEIEFKAKEAEASKDHELKKMDRDYRNKRKLAVDPKEAADMDAEDRGEPSTSKVLADILAEMKRPAKIKRGRDGKAVELE